MENEFIKLKGLCGLQIIGEDRDTVVCYDCTPIKNKGSCGVHYHKHLVSELTDEMKQELQSKFNNFICSRCEKLKEVNNETNN